MRHVVQGGFQHQGEDCLFYWKVHFLADIRFQWQLHIIIKISMVSLYNWHGNLHTDYTTSMPFLQE